MTCHDDLNEIIALISATLESGKEGDPQYCLSQLTHPIGDPCRLARGLCIAEAAKTNDLFLSAIRKFAVKCNRQHHDCPLCPIRKYCNGYIASLQERWDPASPKLVDLFCGAGGLSLGFAQEGFLTALANDIEPSCIDTYSHNHPEIPERYVVLGDIDRISANIRDLLRFHEIDVLIGGPPCQGFSMANRQRLTDDPRNRLYKSYTEVLRQLRPRFFVMENVKGMLSAVDQIVKDFESAGYSVSAKILNAKDCGIPQNRERLIFIGNRIGRDNDAVFNRIEELCARFPKYVLADALYGLKPLSASRVKNATMVEDNRSGRVIDRTVGVVNDYINMINQGRKITVTLNHKARYNNDRDIEIFGRLEPGEKSDDPKIADIMPYARRNHIFKDKYFKLESDRVCKTITAHMKFDCNMYIHPSQARGLTPREAARVQTYPDDYFFRGPYTKTYMQIGNSVPPLLSRVIAQAIKEQL